MLDTKWKSNKTKSVCIAFTLVLCVTLAFMAMLPSFEQRADSEFENPLTDKAFIRMLYGSNYVQYKYLREKSDQRTWSYADLFVEDEFLGLYDEEDNSMDSYRVSVPQDALSDGSDAAREQLKEIKEQVLEELETTKNFSSELVQLMDYYAVDTETGVSIGNSSDQTLQDIVNGKETEDSSYVYYVYMNFDKAGILANCAVRTSGDVGDFLKKVESAGRELYFTENFSDEGELYVSLFSDYSSEFSRYRLTVKPPSGMKIVYAMTAAQYENLLQNDGNSIFLYTEEMSSSSYLGERSYFNAGIDNMVIGCMLLSMALGAIAVWVLNYKKKDNYIFHKLKICGLSFEVNLLILLVELSCADAIVTLIWKYQKGLLLPNITRNILEPAHLSWIKLLVLAAALFLYFGIGFVLGSTIPEILRGKEYFREKSLLCRYWRKIISFLLDFYQELLNFDIGTDAKRIISKLVIINFVILAIISLFWVWGIFPLVIYSLILYFLLKKYVKDVQDKYRNLLKATASIAKGDLDIVLSEDFGVFESYKNELRQIQTDFKRAVDEEVKSQRMKSELITNVSHDLKTPLTAIITYINLLKEPGITEEQRLEYINTLDKKAVRLKVLIEDLFEVSKATTNNITMNYEKADICNLVRQCYLEYEDRFTEADLQFKFLLPEEKVILMLDPQKTFRIFENLYTNIIKYALPSTRVYVIIKNREEDVEIEVKNISRTELQIEPEELTERFVRGDGARNTEGSGLGLAIARSFTELQHGSLNITVDGDLFKVKILFRKWNMDAPNKGGTDTQGGNPLNPSEPLYDPKSIEHPGVAGAHPQTADMWQDGGLKEGFDPYNPRRWRTEKNLRRKQKKDMKKNR